MKRLADLPATRGIRQQLHWHENPQYRFASRPDAMNDADWRRGLARLSDHGLLFELQIFASQMMDGAALARAFPDTVFVLEHAGMLEDMTPAGWRLWRDGIAALAMPERQRQALRTWSFVHACRGDVIGPIVKETVALFGADRCFYGSNFPIEKLWTDYGTLYRTFREAIAHLSEDEQAAILHDTAARLYRICRSPDVARANPERSDTASGLSLRSIRATRSSPHSFASGGRKFTSCSAEMRTISPTSVRLCSWLNSASSFCVGDTQNSARAGLSDLLK